jgi:hypothetical protein
MNLHEWTITPEEQEQLDWCYAALDEEQRVQCEEEAMELAGAELNQDNQDQAAKLLVRLYTRLIIRDVRAERDRGARRQS